MDSLLNRQTLQSFAHEVAFLEKVSGLPGFLRPGNIGRALAHGAGHITGSVGRGIKETPQALRETGSIVSHPLQSLKKGWESSHWLGEKGPFKYLPVGNKSLMAAFAAPGLYDAYKARKESPTPTGEGGVAEKLLGEVGGTGGFLAGLASKRFLPGMALMTAGQYGAGRLGRIIDRLRGGADLGTAVFAPSPTEAEEQLSNIQRYYG